MSEKSIDEILKGFDPAAETDTSFHENHTPLTIWLPMSTKAKYDSLQERSRKRFGKVLKQIIIQSIDKVEDV